MDTKNKYKPISCDFHSLLEHYAVLREGIEFVYRVGNIKHSAKTTIKDISTKDGEEFVELSSGEQIRLDFILSVNGEVLKSYC